MNWRLPTGITGIVLCILGAIIVYKFVSVLLSPLFLIAAAGIGYYLWKKYKEAQ